jgi:hypothetical protein
MSRWPHIVDEPPLPPALLAGGGAPARR